MRLAATTGYLFILMQNLRELCKLLYGTHFCLLSYVLLYPPYIPGLCFILTGASAICKAASSMGIAAILIIDNYFDTRKHINIGSFIFLYARCKCYYMTIPMVDL